MLCLLAIGGCVFLRTTGAASVGDFAAEDVYKATYANHMSEIGRDIQLLAAAGSNPGVCNIGGTKQACYDADTTVIQSMKAMITALEGTSVPPRFILGDKLFRAALTEDIRGLELRNKAIAENDDAAWTEHNVVLDHAVAALLEAYQAFPEDNRPKPAP